MDVSKTIKAVILIQEQIKPLEEKLKELKTALKTEALKNGKKDDKGNYILENGVGKATITSVLKIDNDLAVKHLKSLGRNDLFRVEEVTTVENLKKVLGEEKIVEEGIGGYQFSCRVTPKKDE